jgi:hypothetical protein
MHGSVCRALVLLACFIAAVVAPLSSPWLVDATTHRHHTTQNNPGQKLQKTRKTQENKQQNDTHTPGPTTQTHMVLCLTGPGTLWIFKGKKKGNKRLKDKTPQ